MKKLFAIAAIMALGFTNVFAQVNPFKLLGQKSIEAQTDSVMNGYMLFDYDNNGNEIKSYIYESADTLYTPDSYKLYLISYNVYDAKNRLVEKGQLTQTGDTITKYVYNYTENGGKTNINMIVYNYENINDTSEVILESNFYGIKENDNFTQIFNYLEIKELFGDMFLCDSLNIHMKESEMTEGELTMYGVYSFDAQGNPTKLEITGLEMEGMAMDININFTNENNLLKTMSVEMSMMEGMMKIELLKGTATYSNNLLTELLMEPGENEMMPADMLDKLKINFTYNAKNNMHSISYYTFDAETEKFQLDNKMYYVYKSNDLTDTVKSYIYDVVTGIKINNQINVTISPNPVKDMLQIDGIQSTTQINIYDASGKMVMSKEINSENAVISMQSLSKGLYIIRINNKEGISFKKVIKE